MKNTQNFQKIFEKFKFKKVKFKEVKLENICNVLIGGTPKRAVKKYFIGGKIFGHQFQN